MDSNAVLVHSIRLEMLILDSSTSQVVDATDSTDAPAPSSIPSSQGHNASLLELQSADVVADDVGIGSKRKLRSTVWDGFERVKEGDKWFAICRRCHKNLTTCTRNGTKHLHRHLKMCWSMQATKSINQSTLKLSQNAQDSAVTLQKNVFDQEVARKELALMICIHEYPLSMVEHPGFRNFCSACNPCLR